MFSFWIFIEMESIIHNRIVAYKQLTKQFTFK